MEQIELNKYREIYNSLEQQFGDMEFIIGGFKCFIDKIVEKGDLDYFIDWLNEPLPDWQRDC